MADGSLGLLFRINADPTNAVAGLKTVTRTAQAETTKLIAEFQKASRYTADQKSATDVLLAESQRAIANAQRVAQGASQSLQKTSADLDTARTSASSLGGVFAGALATAGIAAGFAILNLGKQALDAAGELFDLHQKTNFAVETLSALKLAGETAGVSIQSIGGALGIFEKNMVAAAAGNKKLAATFAELKISTSDHEQAIRDAFRALSQMEEGEEQTTAAMALFGRSGKDLLAVLKEMGGDLDGAIAKFREMGVLIDTETAKAADELGDSMTALGQSLKGVATDLIKVLGPALRAIITILEVAIATVRKFIELLNYATDPANAFPAVAEARRLQAQQEAGWGEGPEDKEEFTRNKVEPRSDSPGSILKPWQEMARRERLRSRRGSGGGSANKEKTPDDYGSDLIRGLKEQITALNATDDAIGKAAAEVVNLERRYGALSEAVKTQVYEQARLLQQSQNEIKAADLQAKGQEALREIIARQTRAVEELAGGWETNYEKLDAQIEANERMNISMGVGIENAVRMNALLLDGAELRERIAALPVDVGALFGGAGGGLVQTEGVGLGQQILDDLGGELPPVIQAQIDLFDQLGEAIARNLGFSGENVQVFGGIVTSTFNGMANAMGAVLQQWILTGSTGPAVMRKILAAALSSLASEAAVRAIMETAKGFAALFFNPGEAAAHFTAAGLFASVAGGAALVGRAVAGNAFQEGGGASPLGASGEGRSNTGGSGATTTPPPIEIGRRTDEVHVYLHSEVNPDATVRHVVDDIRSNGTIRSTVLEYTR